jgi:predicted MPP superfamily phosphohydrolase
MGWTSRACCAKPSFGVSILAWESKKVEVSAIGTGQQAVRKRFRMKDALHKRQLIERGLLKTWSKHGRSSVQDENHRVLCALLRVVLRLTGLRRRGEQNALNPVIRTIRLTYNNLPESFCGFSILHLTDLHADGLEGLADAISARLAALEVDLCVLTGDYRFKVRGPCHNIYPPMERILKSVNARLGVVGILGNHDVSEEVPALEALGVRMLINQALELRRGRETAWVIGLDDPHYYGCDDLPGALRRVPTDAFKVLLVHTPELVKEAEAYGIDLYLCGHTHGGQICLPLIGPVVINTSCPRAYARGVWQYKQLQGYTNSGVGASGVPVRFFCPPEIGLIELRCARHHEHATSPAHDGLCVAEHEETARSVSIAELR